MGHRSIVGVIALWPAIALATPSKPAPAACIASRGKPEVAVIDGTGKLAYCLGSKKPVCYATDLDTGATSVAAAPPTPIGPSVEVTDKGVIVCRPDGTKCKTLKPTGRIDEGLGISGEANAEGTLAAVINQKRVETFDLKRGKRLASFDAGKGLCTWVQWLGDVLHVTNLECGSDGGPSWLATKQGKRIATVGGDQPIDAGGAVAVGTAQVAFASRTGDVVVVHDTKTGAVSKRITIGPPAADAAFAGRGDRLALVYGGERAGDIAVVDLATAKVTSYPAKRCP